jgi:MoxR-like ATPase
MLQNMEENNTVSDERAERKETNLTEFADKIDTLKGEIAKTVIGQEKAVDLLLTAILADGHVLIEGVPGVAKTMLAKVLSRLIDAKFSRIQFTPDLMPSDVLGTTVFNVKTSDFDFHAGPVFGNIILADEINRAPAKTQAALFEVMEERQATVDGISHRMEPLYMIIATQNPVEQEGTYKLPEAQLDRFIMKIDMGYPSDDEEVTILKMHNTNATFVNLDNIKPIITIDEIMKFRSVMNHVVVDDTLLKYIIDIVAQTRNSRAVFLGASPRAAVAILQASKGFALLDGRDFVTPDDIKAVTPYVLQHRLLLTAEAEMEGYTANKVATKLIDKVEVPK